MAIQKPIFVPINGLSTSPSDYLAKDGELAAALGVYREDGVITCASNFAPSIVVDDLYDDRVLYQHKGGDFAHLIITENTDPSGQCRYVWRPVSDTSVLGGYFDALQDKQVTSVVAIGNALVFYTADQPYFYRWDGDHYIELGSSLPEPSLSFCLTAHPYRALEDMHGAELSRMQGNSLDEYKDNLTSFSFDGNLLIKSGTIPLVGREPATNAAFADVNYFQGKWCSEHGYFSQPFLLRYAFRLFDGTLTKHSAPILMLPSMSVNPCVYIMAKEYHDEISTICIDTVGVACSIIYRINNMVSGLSDWRDIIQGIELFVSSPIYTYDSSKQCERIETDESNGMFYPLSESIMTCAHNPNEAFGDNLLDSIETMLERLSHDQRFGISSARGGNVAFLNSHNSVNATAVCFYKPGVTSFAMENHNLDGFTSTGYAPAFRIVLPERPSTSIIRDIRECSTFYQVFSIPFDDILDGRIAAQTWHDADIEDGVLGSLVAREAMTDDYDSHHTLVPSGVSEYNSRLNIFNVEKHFFDGFPVGDAYQRTFRQDNTTYFTDFYTLVFCNDSATSVLCRQHSEVNLDFNAPVGYFYYPDPSAKRVIQFAVRRDGAIYRRQFPLREHVGLNGAVYFDSYGGGSDSWQLTTSEELDNYWENERGASSVTHPNVIYTSEATNPFSFRAANVEQIGGGQIIAMVPAAQPLSQGQFGDFPMYAFTTEGIWALYPNDTGGWQSKQPISRDVVLSPESILQLDRSVVFATSRGLMEIAGSRVACMSEVFDGPADMFFEDYSSHLFDLITYHTDIISWDDDTATPFRQFVAGCRMVYDYPHQRIIVGNPDYPFSYIYNIKDKVWTSIPIRVLAPVNSYPQAYAMVSYGSGINMMVDFASAESPVLNMAADGFILTRPLKLGLPDTLKTVRSVNVRGNFFEASRFSAAAAADHHIDLVLYGSNDPAMRQWHVLASCRGPRLQFRYGTPFKAFRIAILARLRSGESIAGMEVQTETKETDKIR